MSCTSLKHMNAFNYAGVHYAELYRRTSTRPGYCPAASVYRRDPRGDGDLSLGVYDPRGAYAPQAGR